MSWNSIMGLISSVTLFLPIVLIITLRLGTYRSFPVLIVYYALIFVYNLFTEGYINAGSQVTYYLGLTNNLLDAPLILSFLTYFSTSATFTRRIRILILFFLLFEAVILVFFGLNIRAITIIIGPGLITILAFCVFFFVRQAKITIIHQKATGKALIVSSLLFAYGCYIIIYLIYYIFKFKDVTNTFLIYFLVTIFSSLLMCAGIIIERKRVQKLVELKVARKELSILYDEPTTSASLKTASINKERYN